MDRADGSDPSPQLLIRSVPLPAAHQGDVRRRLTQAAVVTTRRLAPLARRRPVQTEDLARALRLVFDDMGGTFAKLGQLVGSASGLFGETFSAEFRTTLDNVTPIPYPDVRLAVEDAFGLPMDCLFAEFDEEPIAAASLAAVHRAVLPDGRTVAVKVLRPGIEEKMAIDIAVMRPLFDFLGHQLAVGVLGEFPSLIQGLEEQLSEEVDLRNEARSMLWFEDLRHSLEFERLHVPLPIEGYVAKRVLAMTFVNGACIDDLDAIATLGIDPAPLVQECTRAWFASALCTGAFHGDVHAGNLMITDAGQLAVLDWGIVGRLDPDTHRFFRRMVEGVMGDETAWVDVWATIKATYGTALQESIGLTDEQMVQVCRLQMEPIFHQPFGQVKLTDLLVNNDAVNELIGKDATPPAHGRERLQRALQTWRTERAFRKHQRDSGVRDTSFDRSLFLLGKQLAYFERYGKLFLPDTPLLSDPVAFEKLLAQPTVLAEGFATAQGLMPKVSDEHKDAVRRRIMDAALVCLARNDFQHVTTRELLAEADLSTGTFYNYFASKEHLFEALAEELLADDIDRLHAPGPGAGLLDFLRDYLLADPVMAATMSRFRSEIDRSGDAREAIERLNAFVVREFTPLVAAAQAEGFLRDDVDAEAAVELFDIVWDGLGRRQASGSFQTSYRRVGETLLQIVLDGVLAPGDASEAASGTVSSRPT